MANEWSMSGLFVSAAKQVAEVYEPGIFNPGEEMGVSIKLTPSLPPGKTVQVLLATDNGVSVPTQIMRVVSPVVTTNTGLAVVNGATMTIDSTKLFTSDPDADPDGLTYTIVTLPKDGTLSKTTTFTQADINNGLLTYTRTSAGADSFTFTVSNGDSSTATVDFVLP
jgi:hypothetical protein